MHTGCSVLFHRKQQCQEAILRNAYIGVSILHKITQYQSSGDNMAMSVSDTTSLIPLVLNYKSLTDVFDVIVF